MLGKLTKWLRFIGYDVLYPKTLDDKELAQLSRVENRYLLTRDKELANLRDLKVLYISSDNLDAQLIQVKDEFNLKLSSDIFCRCPECNSMLKEIDKSQLKDKVPLGVLERQNLFWVCENCTRYYWRGTHYNKIKAKLEELFTDNPV